MGNQLDNEQMPSDYITEAVPIDDNLSKSNLWRKSISNITWGLILTSFTLNFLLLQFILPTLGIILLYLGFHSLRKLNRLFFTSWVVVILQLIWQTVQLVFYATPLIVHIQSNLVIGSISLVFKIILLLVFRSALRAVYRQFNVVPSRDPLLGAVIWMVIITLCSLTPLAYLGLAFIPLLILYFMNIRSLSRAGDELRHESYHFAIAPVKLGNTVVTLGYLAFSLILVAISCIFANHIKLEASEQATTNSVTRTALIDLGFPENILSDVSDKDVAMLDGAIHIETSSDLLSFDPVKITTKSGSNSYMTRNKPGNNNLQATTIYIEFPDNLLYVLMYLDWIDTKAYWQDGFTIWGEEGFELLHGVLLYEKKGVNYTAPIPRLSCEVLTSYSMFGADESRQISGAVSYPFGSQHQKGYVFYRLQLPKEQWIGCNGMNYIHYTHPLQIPYMKTEERLLNGTYFSGDKQIHYSTFELEAARNANTKLN